MHVHPAYHFKSLYPEYPEYSLYCMFSVTTAEEQNLPLGAKADEKQ